VATNTTLVTTPVVVGDPLAHDVVLRGGAILCEPAAQYTIMSSYEIQKK
jgi:hypothetical protein